MKKLIGSLTTMLIVVLMISMNSCDAVSDIVPIPSMKATVDGVEWTSIFRASVLNETDANIIITGTPEASEQVDKAIILTVFATEAGTYNFDPLALTGGCAAAYKKTSGAAEGGDNYYVAYDATITISSLDKDKKRMSGTFSAKLRSTGNLVDEVIITNGTFENLNYQIQ